MGTLLLFSVYPWVYICVCVCVSQTEGVCRAPLTLSSPPSAQTALYILRTIAFLNLKKKTHTIVWSGSGVAAHQLHSAVFTLHAGQKPKLGAYRVFRRASSESSCAYVSDKLQEWCRALFFILLWWEMMQHSSPVMKWKDEKINVCFSSRVTLDYYY